MLGMLGVYIAYLCTTFDQSRFSRLRDTVVAHQNLNGFCNLTTPFSGMICHSMAKICYDQLAC